MVNDYFVYKDGEEFGYDSMGTYEGREDMLKELLIFEDNLTKRVAEKRCLELKAQSDNFPETD